MSVSALFSSKKLLFLFLFTLLLVNSSFGQLLPCANNNDDEPPFTVAQAYDPNYNATLELATSVIGPGDDFCIGNDPGKDTEGGTGSFLFTELQGGQDGCPVQFCFSPRQGCGSALGNTCIWIEDPNNPGEWLNLGEFDKDNFTELCVLAPPGVTEFAIAISRPGQGPVSVNDIIVTQPPTIDIGTDKTACITDLPTTIDLTVNEPSGQTGGSWTIGGTPIANPDAYLVNGILGEIFTFTYTYDASGDVGYTCLISDELIYTINDTCFVCPTLNNESPDLGTCIDTQTQTVSVDTDVDDIDIEFVWFTSTQVDPYIGGTQIGTAVTPVGGTATSNATINFAAAGTYYVYSILDTDDADLTDPSCRPFTEIIITIDEQLVAGVDGTLTICEGEIVDESELFAALGATAQTGGEWTPVFAAGSATYTYTHAATATCPEVSAVVEVTAVPALVAGVDGTLTICEGEIVDEAELFAALGATAQTGGEWTPVFAAGSATYTYTHAATATCPEVSAVVEVTAVPLPIIEIADQIACETTVGLNISLLEPIGQTGGIWSNASGVIADPTSGVDPHEGPFTYTYTNEDGCEGSDQVAYTFRPIPDAGEDNSITVCDGTIVDLSTLTSVDGGVFDDLDDTGQLSDSLFDTSGLSPGNYEFLYDVEDLDDLCKPDSAIITVTVDEPADAGADNTTSVCESTIVDLATLATVAGGTFTTNGGGVLIGSEFDTSGLAPGDYTVTYTVVSGVCEDEALITISVAEDIILQTCEASPATFCGDGTTKYDFYWFGSNQSSGGSNFFGSNTSNLTFTEFNDGTALIQGTTALGSCTATLYIKLNGKKNWADWQSQEGGTFKNMGCTNPDPANLEYYVIDNTASTITTNGGDCLEEGTFIVSQKPDPNDPLTPHLGVIVGPGGVLHGLDATANGIAGWAYMGTEENPKKYEIDFNFELSCTDATGCDLEQSCDNLVPEAGVPASYTACEDEAITMNDLYALLGNTAELGGTWSPATFNGPDVYTYTHAANGNCVEKSATVTVEVQGKLSAGTDGAITVCEGDILTNEDLFAQLSGADEGGTWSDLVSGVYTYIVGGSGSCSEDTATVTVTYTAKPNAGTDGEITVCEGAESPSNDELFAALTDNPDSGGTWEMTNDYFEYTVQGEGSCVDKAYVVIHKAVVPNAGEAGTLNVCEGATPTDDELFAALTDADMDGTWSDPVSGVYTYTVTADCGTDEAIVTVTEMTSLSAGEDGALSVCEGATPTEDELFAALTDADMGGSWSDPVSGVYTYSLTADCGTDEAIVTVTEMTSPSAGEDGALIICEGATPSDDELFAALTDADMGGTWSDPVSGVYTYTVTADCGTDEAIVTVTEMTSPSAGEDGALTICEGATPTEDELFAALTAANMGGTWSDPVSGVYTYTITADCGTDEAIVTVTEMTSPSAGEDASITICEGISVDLSTLVSEAGGTFENTSGMGSLTDSTFDTTGLEPGTYNIAYTVANDCGEDEALITVVVDTTLNCDDTTTGCETSYARYQDSNSCFISDMLGANRWGWTNYFKMEGEYVMDLYAGAGGCNLMNGEKSGNVYVAYADGKVTVRAVMLPGFVMTLAHMYIGDEPYPLDKKGDPTVANGQLGNISEDLDNETTYEFGPFDVSNYTNGVYVIFHADTCKKGVTSKAVKTAVTAYPMTFKNDLNLKVDILYDAQLKVEMFDVNGRCILSKKGMNVKSGSNNVHLNVSSLSSDMYILIIDTGREKIIKKVLSKK